LEDRDEIKERPAYLREIESWKEASWDSTKWSGDDDKYTYRTRLSRSELAALDNPTQPKKLPEDWCRELNMTVMDPDGWDRKNFEKDWNIPLTRAEFDTKSARSTTRHDKYVPSRFATSPPTPCDLTKEDYAAVVGLEFQDASGVIYRHFWEGSGAILFSLTPEVNFQKTYTELRLQGWLYRGNGFGWRKCEKEGK